MDARSGGAVIGDVAEKPAEMLGISLLISVLEHNNRRKTRSLLASRAGRKCLARRMLWIRP